MNGFFSTYWEKIPHISGALTFNTDENKLGMTAYEMGNISKITDFQYAERVV